VVDDAVGAEVPANGDVGPPFVRHQLRFTRDIRFEDGGDILDAEAVDHERARRAAVAVDQ
jgi:hypothetical protein